MKPYRIENKIQKAPLSQVTVGGYPALLMDAFFEERIFSDYAKNVVFKETYDAFVNCTDGDKPIGLWQGEYWGKWILGAVRACRYTGDVSMKDFIHTEALKLIALQRESGYLGTYKDSMNFFPPVGESVDWNWNVWCRKYTLWGLLEAYELTEDEALLTACIRLADNLIDEIRKAGVRLGETGAFKGLPSCSILKPMLVLYRITEDERYLSFCQTFADEWENPAFIPGLIANTLSGKPLSEWYDFNLKWAKAYEMMSCYDGLVEMYRVTGEIKYLTVSEKFYDLIMTHESNPLYSVAFNDEFRSASRSINAISEPCDVIHLMRLCHELFTLTGNVRYMDTFELAFYNPFLAGSFKDGKWGARGVRGHGRHLSVQGQANMKYNHCCVNNMPRGYLNMAESAVMTDDNSIYVNLYTPLTASVTAGSTSAAITVTGDYLADSRAVISLDFQNGTPCPVKLRVPTWTKQAKITVDGKEYCAESGYFTVLPSAGHAEIEVQFDNSIRIVPLKATPVDKEDPWKVRRFAEGSLPADTFLTEDRCILQKGALLLCRSKLIGNTEGEMFSGKWIDATYKAECQPVVPAEGINVQFKLTLYNGTDRLTMDVCDYASGSNIVSTDNSLFSIYF